MDFSLSGLASGFDWKTFIDQIITAQTAPITKLTNEKTQNINKTAALADLNTKLSALQTSSSALNNTSLFTGRKATLTTANSTWSSSAAAGTAVGSYKIAVSKLATAARLEGSLDVGQPLSATDDVAALTIASLPTSVGITAGTFSVNGNKVTVALTDSLDQVFSAISAATGGTVTASYDHTTDKITLQGAGEIILGAANDTSNFLNSLKLANNGLPTIESSSRLGALNMSATVANSRLNSAITSVDGTFSINGVSITYDQNVDSLSTILGRINKSTAGVTASYDRTNDRITLVNNVTGDSGIAISESAGGLMAALGLTGASLVRGQNAEFTVNGGGILTSSSNTLDEKVHGIAGLSVTADIEATQTISVTGDTASMRSAIEDFIAKFNDVQSYIAEQSKTSKTVDGKVTTSLLSNNREVQSWSDSLRTIAFGAVPGLAGTIGRLENLGIDFSTGTSQLSIRNGLKLDTALREKSADVAEFFQSTTTGFNAQMQTFLTRVVAQNSQQQTQLNKTNSGITDQIATIQRRLDQQRALLTSSFIAMETAQSKLKSQSDALTRAFPSTTTSK